MSPANNPVGHHSSCRSAALSDRCLLSVGVRVLLPAGPGFVARVVVLPLALLETRTGWAEVPVFWARTWQRARHNSCRKSYPRPDSPCNADTYWTKVLPCVRLTAEARIGSVHIPARSRFQSQEPQTPPSPPRPQNLLLIRDWKKSGLHRRSHSAHLSLCPN